MGCDIHNWAEVKIDGKWEVLGDVFPNPFYNPSRQTEYNREFTDEPYCGRNYNLFALLAGVRNKLLTPIAPARGIPEDASEGYKKHCESWSGDGHSHSWYTLKELTEFNYESEIEDSGIVSSEQYKTYKENGRPDGWCGGVAGYFQISQEDMDLYLEDPRKFVSENLTRLVYERFLSQTNRLLPFSIYRSLEKPQDFEIPQRDIELINSLQDEESFAKTLQEIDFYCEVKWKENLRETVGENFFEAIEQMKLHAPNGNFEDIRLVFFFDN